MKKSLFALATVLGLVTAAGKTTFSELWTFQYQAQGTPGQGQFLEVWLQEPPDTAWALAETVPYEPQGTISVWVTATSRVRARSLWILPAIPPSGLLLPGVPEQRLYSTWSNELRFTPPTPPSTPPRRIPRQAP